MIYSNVYKDSYLIFSFKKKTIRIAKHRNGIAKRAAGLRFSWVLKVVAMGSLEQMGNLYNDPCWYHFRYDKNAENLLSSGSWHDEYPIQFL